MPWLRRLFAGLAPCKSGFNPRPVHVELVFDKLTLEQNFLLVIRFPPRQCHTTYASYLFTQLPPTLHYPGKWQRHSVTHLNWKQFWIAETKQSFMMNDERRQTNMAETRVLKWVSWNIVFHNYMRRLGDKLPRKMTLYAEPSSRWW